LPSDAAQLQQQQAAARRARRASRQRDKRRTKANEKSEEGETKSEESPTSKRKAAINKVNQILDENTAPKRGPRGPKGKLSHVANFINEKHTGVVDSEADTLKGKYLLSKMESGASFNIFKLWMFPWPLCLVCHLASTESFSSKITIYSPFFFTMF
jgi:hypothetical protein